MDTPSFFRSTLSLAFIGCVVAVVAMIFLKIDANQQLFQVISGVVGAYLGSRIPSSEKKTPVDPTSNIQP